MERVVSGDGVRGHITHAVSFYLARFLFLLIRHVMLRGEGVREEVRGERERNDARAVHLCRFFKAAKLIQ